MKNLYTVRVSFNNYALMPYEWTTTELVSGVRLIRIPSDLLEQILRNDIILKLDSYIMLLSDTKTTIVVRTDKNGKVLSRSFLTFDDDLKYIELAKNLPVTQVKYKILEGKILYNSLLQEEIEMKKYITDKIKKCEDTDKAKYLYYLYFNDVNNYSKSRLLSSIKTNDIKDFRKLYEFLLKYS